MPVPPTHRVGFVDSDSIASVAYSPDSKEIFVALNIESVNVWRIVVDHWPWTFGAAALLMALAGVFLLRRILARPHRKGRTYCSKCNHEVSDPALPCPECGTSLASRGSVVKGKSFRRRVWPACALIAIAGIGYGTLWLLPAKRVHSTRDWLHVWCGPLLRFAKAHQIAFVMNARESIRMRIAVIDVATGKRVRDLGTFAGSFHRYQDMRIKVSPDGSHLYIPDRDTDLIALDTQTGNVWHRLRFDSTSLVNQIAGVAPDGKVVYATFHDRKANRVSLIRWDVNDDRCRVVKSVPGDFIPKAVRPECAPRFYLVPGGDSPTFLQIPATGEVLEHLVVSHSPSRLEWFTEASPDQVAGLDAAIDFDADPMPLGRPGRMAFTLNYSGLASLDVGTGALTTLIEPNTYLFNRPIHETGANRLIFAGRMQQHAREIVAYHTEARALVLDSVMPPLSMAQSDVCDALFPAPDLRSLVAETCYDAGGQDYISQLLIFDLRPYPKLRELEFGTSDSPATSSPP